MRTTRKTVAAAAASIAAAGVMVALVPVSAAAGSGSDARAALPGSVAAIVTSQPSLGAAPATQNRTVQVWLRPKTAAAARFISGVSTPGSASFGHFLSPNAYTARFGASRTAAAAVAGWLRKQGFTGVHPDSQRNYVAATAATSTVDHAFGVQIDKYRVATTGGHSQIVESNDRAVTVPKSLAPDVLAVTGLNNRRAVPFHTATKAQLSAPASVPKSAPCSHYWGQHVVHFSPAFRGLHRLPTANCGYSSLRYRAAYGLRPRNSGKGQRVALIEIGTPYKMVKTLRQYAKKNGMPTPRPSQYEQLTIGRGNQCGNEFDIEEQLDSEAVFTTAPKAQQLLVGGDSCDVKLEGVQPLYDAQLRVLDGAGRSPLASIESNSWGLSGAEAWPRTYLTVAHSILMRAAAEGVAMLVCSQDSPGIAVPSDDPLALAIGGTTIGIGKHGARKFETGWSDDQAFLFGHKWHDFGIGRSAAGGGTSLVYAQPKYQRGIVPHHMSHLGVGRNAASRAVPDISADADPNTGIAQLVTEHTKNGDKFVWFDDGGTSLATPLVAGILADAQQGRHRFGFVNPAIYQLAGTRALHDSLPVTSASRPTRRGAICDSPRECGGAAISIFDSQRAQFTEQVTRRGYDTMTGLGTPNGTRFIAALRRIESRH